MAVHRFSTVGEAGLVPLTPKLFRVQLHILHLFILLIVCLLQLECKLNRGWLFVYFNLSVLPAPKTTHQNTEAQRVFAEREVNK